MSKDTRQKLADLLDQRMLEALRDGQEVVDQKTGALIRIPPTPAMLKAVMERMKQLGADDVPLHNTPAGILIEQVRIHQKREGVEEQLSHPIEDFDE